MVDLVTLVDEVYGFELTEVVLPVEEEYPVGVDDVDSFVEVELVTGG